MKTRFPHRHTPPRAESLERRSLLAATELARNGGFEVAVSSSDWTLSGNFQADSRFALSHTGAGYAYVSNADGSAGNSLAGSMVQQVTIPSNLTSLTLNFWTRISTSETTTTAANDTMSIVIQNAAGTATLQTLGTLSNLNASASYVQRSFALSRALIGQTVRIAFSAATNATLATTFRVDDVNLNGVSSATTNRIVGYLPYYRYSSAFSKIDWTALTHVNYFSISADTAGALTTTNVTASALNAVVAAAHAAGVTVGITVGPASFSTLANSATARQTFANNVVNYALQYNLDAIDIDWEPPAGNNVASYGSLISDLYTVANPQKIMITAAVNPWTNEIPAATVNAKMDWLNVMCYDFDYANHSTYSQAVSGMTDWTAYGVTRNKILMGSPFYGKQGTSWSNDTSETYATMIANHLAANGNTFPSPDLDFIDNFYGNGVETLRKKMQYVADNGYGGAMIWELGQDRWNSSSLYDYHSLLPVMKSVLRQSGAIGTVTTSPADNGNLPASGTQTVAVTVTFVAPSAGVLQVSLVDEAYTPARDWVSIASAGTVTQTLNVPISQLSAGQQFYEIYTQFRPGASAGPLTAIDDADILKLTPFRINWLALPGVPGAPSPADGALLSAPPVLLNWADVAGATSYDVYVSNILRANVMTSQWPPNISFTSGANYIWRVQARNTAGTTTGPTWSFRWVAPDLTPPTPIGGTFDADSLHVTIDFSELLASTAGDAFIAVASGGAETSLGAGIVSGNSVTYSIPSTLANGDYQFRLPAGSVFDRAGNPLAADSTMPFFILAGDLNRDRVVNFDDLLVLAQNYGQSGLSFTQGNLDRDLAGNVDFDDLLLLAQWYGTSLVRATPSSRRPGRATLTEIA